MLNKIIESCNYLLNNYPEAQDCREYLDSRINKESQDLFQFGYFPNTYNMPALTSVIDEQILYKNNLLYPKEINDSLGFRTYNISHFENYPLVMPFKDPYGNVVGIVGRTLLSDDKRGSLSKYKNTKSFTKGNYVFGLYENKRYILEKDSVYVVEGQFDVIKASEKGLKNIVALGTSSMTIYQFSVISRYTNNIFLLLDNDSAGEKGRKNIVKQYGNFANICNFYLPENYKDIDEYLSNNDYDSLSFIVKD